MKWYRSHIAHAAMPVLIRLPGQHHQPLTEKVYPGSGQSYPFIGLSPDTATARISATPPVAADQQQYLTCHAYYRSEAGQWLLAFLNQRSKTIGDGAYFVLIFCVNCPMSAIYI